MTEREKLLQLEAAMLAVLATVSTVTDIMAGVGCTCVREIIEREAGAVLVSTCWMLRRMAQELGVDLPCTT